jgi:hypothetical protein
MTPDYPSKSAPSVCSVLRTLRDGFWDRTEVIRLSDGALRVRKSFKGDQSTGPWGAATLRREIRYMEAMDGQAAKYFPKLLAAWATSGQLGYEMSYVKGALDAGSLARSGAMTQMEADAFQERLAEVVFGVLHRPVASQDSLAEHLLTVINDVLERLGARDDFKALIDAPMVLLNGRDMRGPRAAFRWLVECHGATETLDRPPCVRLHGDLFLENILLPWGADRPTELILIDPVSVAGIVQGHPLFDLVKYESYATGELPAMRSEKVQIDGFGSGARGRYVYRVCLDDPAIRPFRQIDWQRRFRAAYVLKYGRIDWVAYRLLEAYFALVMAVCTKGVQRRARLCKGTWALNAAMSDWAAENKAD